GEWVDFPQLDGGGWPVDSGQWTAGLYRVESYRDSTLCSPVPCLSFSFLSYRKFVDLVGSSAVDVKQQVLVAFLTAGSW
ncbi:hypothetical protein C6P43_003455, partial [Kluyveromyces marxianus]